MRIATMQNRYKGPAAKQEPAINLSAAERTISIAGGTKLALSGLKGIFRSPFSSIIKIGAGSYLLNRGITGHCQLYAGMGRNSTEPVNINIRSTFFVAKPREEVYAFWRKLDNLPLFMNHLKSVELVDDIHSHWVLKMPLGAPSLSWDAAIVHDDPGYMIGWSSLPDSMIDNAGKVRFQDSPDGLGTLLDVTISYRPPAGGFGGGIAHLLNPVFKNMVDSDIRNFKRYMDIEDNGLMEDAGAFEEPIAFVVTETFIDGMPDNDQGGIEENDRDIAHDVDNLKQRSDETDRPWQNRQAPGDGTATNF